MKKVLTVLMVASVVSFVACKGKAEGEAPAADSTKMETPAVEPTATPAEDSTKMMVADSTKKEEPKMEEKKEEKKK